MEFAVFNPYKAMGTIPHAINSIDYLRVPSPRPVQFRIVLKNENIYKTDSFFFLFYFPFFSGVRRSPFPKHFPNVASALLPHTLIHLFCFDDLPLGWTLFKIRGPRLAVVDVEFECAVTAAS
jgi:hypothetical protein